MAVAASVFAASARGDFGVQPQSLEFNLLDGNGSAVQAPPAGAHPFAQRLSFAFNTTVHDYPGSGPEPDPDGAVKTFSADLPPGMFGNPEAAPFCAAAEFLEPPGCPTATQVGIIELDIGLESGAVPKRETVPVFSLAPPKGVFGRIGFRVAVVPVTIDFTLRSDGDYGVTATAHNLSEAVNVYKVALTLWGVPADPGHDAERYRRGAFFPGDELGNPLPSDQPPAPFISNPTRCDRALSAGLRVDSWQDPGSFLSYLAAPIGFTRCDEVPFEPTIGARPTSARSDAPSGMEFKLHIPQEEDPEGLTSAHLRDAVVELPAGMTLNPPAADVLDACSLDQIGISAGGVADEHPVTCPDASILGKAEVVSPALGHPLPGVVYLAAQNENPFGSPFAIYLVLDDPASGALIKLPGRVEPDRDTGRVTVTFSDNPQLPLEDLEIRLFGGDHAALKTPAACGKHTTSAALTPWTAPDGETATPASSFRLTSGPEGGACLPGGAAAPSQPSFVAGSAERTARAVTPFRLEVSRADGSQPLAGIDTTLPPGLLAKLGGASTCSELDIYKADQRTSGKAEQAQPSCPASSRVGGIDIGAGAGPTPLYVSGSLYLAGPYKGAPLSLVAIVPALAGPFDLGSEVIRIALDLNAETAQVHAVSDPFPTILQGIPIDMRSVAVTIDRPDFTFNPTSCEPMAVTGTATTLFGQSTVLSSYFQTDECARLAFEPKLGLHLLGGLGRNGHPGLRAVLRAGLHEAGIAAATITLPPGELLDLQNLGALCGRDLAPERCPRASRLGLARVWTPVLSEPLQGPIYLRAPSGPLPELLAALRGGGFRFLLRGRIAGSDGRLRLRFPHLPDIPLSKALISLAGGGRGLIVNSEALCAHPHRASVVFSAHNGKQSRLRPLLRVPGRC